MRLHLAGSETPIFYHCAKVAGAKSFLMSYYYAFYKKKKWDDALSVLRYDSTDNWIIDSGLFTMMFGSGKNQTYTREDLEKYTYKYLETMKKIEYTGTIVEMDVHKILGMDEVKDFRAIFEANWPLDRTIFVWHIEERIEGLIAMCKKYPYIALSIPELRKVVKHISLEKYLHQLLALCHKANPNIKIHLLGDTEVKLMSSELYTTCDSTSWLSGARYGIVSMNYIKDGKLKKTAVRHKNLKNFQEVYESCAVAKSSIPQAALDKIEKSDGSKILVIGATNFLMLQKYINGRFYKHHI